MDFSQINTLFIDAVEHHKIHKCGGAPYKSFRELYSFLKQHFSKISFEKFGETKILEIGTATGLMTYFFAKYFINAKIQSLEIEKVHVELAEKLLRNFSAPNVQLINCDALSYMQYCPVNVYDIIFFDGFSPGLDFLNQYERILKKDGILISANSHLSLSKTREYFEKLSDENKWKKLTSFGDTIIYQKLF